MCTVLLMVIQWMHIFVKAHCRLLIPLYNYRIQPLYTLQETSTVTNTNRNQSHILLCTILFHLQTPSSTICRQLLPLDFCATLVKHFVKYFDVMFHWHASKFWTRSSFWNICLTLAGKFHFYHINLMSQLKFITHIFKIWKFLIL